MKHNPRKTNRNWNYECAECGAMAEKGEVFNNHGNCKKCMDDLFEESRNFDDYTDWFD